MLGKISDNVPRFIAKKWIEVHDQSGNAEDRYKPSKQTSMLRSDLCNFSDAYIAVKGTITVTNPENNAYAYYLLKIIHRLFLAFEKLIMQLTLPNSNPKGKIFFSSYREIRIVESLSYSTFQV